jgi:hypothetical protein
MGASFSGTPSITQFAGNTWNYYGAAQTVRGITYNNLILSGSGTKTTTSVRVNGILEMGGIATVSVAPTYGTDAGLLYNTSSARTAGLEWTSSFSGTSGITISNTGMITLNSAEILNTTLTIEAGATLNTSSSNNYSLTIGGVFTNNGVLTINGSSVNIVGSWINNGTFNSGTGTVSFNGGQSQIIGGTGVNTFNNLTVSNASGLSLDCNVNIKGTLTFYTGKVITGSNYLILGNSANVSGASSSRYVYGNLVKGIASATTSKYFEIGDATVYAPVTITFSGSTNNTGTITASTADGDSPEVNSSNINPLLNVNRYWSFENTGVTGFTSYDATYTFASEDVDAGAVPTSFIAGIYSSFSWDYPGVETATATTVQVTGLTTFGDFQTGEPKIISGAEYGDNGSVPVIADVLPCINIPSNHITVSSVISAGQYFTMNVIKGLNYQVYSCNTSSPANQLMLTVYREGAPSEVALGFAYVNTGNPCSTAANNVFISFIPEFSGQVRILINRKGNVRSVTPSGITVKINVSGGKNTLDNQSASGINSWTGHIYDGNNFNTYLGYYSTTEIFQETFGSGGVWPNNTNDDVTCFNFMSAGSTRGSLKVASYSVRYRMNSDRKGLFAATITSDDGSRLSVDGTQVYSDWTDHSPKAANNVLFNLDGNSELTMDYYENGGQNVIGFTNLVQILSNTLSPNTNQQLCIGSQGVTVSGDVYGTLPVGITLSGTGYQWAYSTVSSTGPWTNIAGATSSAFTPSSLVAPFNTPGTFFLIRKAQLTSSNNVTPNPYLVVSESNVITITVTTVGKWLGVSGSDWHTTSNWCGGIPSSGTDVLIPAGMPNQPVISSDIAFCNDITIEAGAVLTITAGNKLTVGGIISNNAGAEGIILKSGSEGSASLIHNNNNVPATVELYIDGVAEAWHFLSSPVSDQTISGDWLPAGTYGNGTGYDLYVWDEATSCWIYKLDTNPSVNWSTEHPENHFVTGRGYLYSIQNPNSTKIFNGFLNNGVQDIALTSDGVSAAMKGFNLAGNPYPSSIDWQAASGWSRSDLTASGTGYDMWIWNPAANNYGVINSDAGSGTNGVTGLIAPMQGFFVRADNSGILSMTNSLRVHDGASNWMKKGEKSDISTISLSVKSEKGLGSDEIKLCFGSETDKGGSVKLFSQVPSAPSLFMTHKEENYSVRSFTDTIINPSVQVMFKPGYEGNYTLECNGNAESFGTLILEDRKRALFHDLKKNNIYSFSSSKKDDQSRFVLHFVPVADPETPNIDANIYVSNRQLVIDLTNVNGSFQALVYDLAGHLLANKKLMGETNNIFDIESRTQILIVRLNSQTSSISRKIMWIN